MMKTAQENVSSDSRIKSELRTTNGISSIISYKLQHIGGKVVNMKYWQPWGEKILRLLKTGQVRDLTSEINIHNSI